MPSDDAGEYHLGYSDAEAERLIRQGQYINGMTEQFFRSSGVELGQRVLDVGSGVGEVALILSKLIGPAGEIVGVERDGVSVERATARLQAAGVHNVEFVRADITAFSTETLFDAVVGRYVLQFLPDPVAVLRSLSAMVKPGGIVAFQEASFAPFVALSDHLPLRSTCARLMRDLAVQSGVRVEMGPELYKAFQDAGLPAPAMRFDMPLGRDPEFTRLLSDRLVIALRDTKRQTRSMEALGDPDTLADRLREEVERSNSVVPWLALVGASCRKHVTPA
jgi:ubiquinone/menaquinone biosynthesis C-methylase UbiE